MKTNWFAAKRYGYGWYPVTWQGWLTTLGFVVLIVAPTGIPALIGPEGFRGAIFAWLYVSYAAVLIILLLLICVKTGEPTRWRWGGK